MRVVPPQSRANVEPDVLLYNSEHPDGKRFEHPVYKEHHVRRYPLRSIAYNTLPAPARLSRVCIDLACGTTSAHAEMSRGSPS